MQAGNSKGVPSGEQGLLLVCWGQPSWPLFAHFRERGWVSSSQHRCMHFRLCLHVWLPEDDKLVMGLENADCTLQHCCGQSHCISLFDCQHHMAISLFLYALRLSLTTYACRPRGRSSIIVPSGGADCSAWLAFRSVLARIEARTTNMPPIQVPDALPAKTQQHALPKPHIEKAAPDECHCSRQSVQHSLYPLCGQSFLAHLLLCKLSVGCSAESVGVWAWNVCPWQHGLLF